MLISESYREQNRLLHSRGSFGFKGGFYAKEILPLSIALKSRDILDYGCGQKTLEKELGGTHLQFIPGVSYRNLLLYRGGDSQPPFSADTRATPPHDLTDKSVLDRVHLCAFR